MALRQKAGHCIGFGWRVRAMANAGHGFTRAKAAQSVPSFPTPRTMSQFSAQVSDVD
jgi:hypothetical protein